MTFIDSQHFHPNPGEDIAAVSDPWLGTIVDAIRNSSYWSSTVIVITFDESGGFFDHVPPPLVHSVALQLDQLAGQHGGVGPDGNNMVPLGVRVATIVVSPFSPATINSFQYDHTSALKMIEWQFNLEPIGGGTGRDASGDVTNLACALDFATPRTVKINFQPAATPVPSGYLPDAGLAFADRGNGWTYGWNADNMTNTRERNAANSPDKRYDTLTYMQRSPNLNAFWEIALTNGTYSVRVVAGDPSFYDNQIAISAEGVVIVSGVTTSTQPWLDGTQTVTVGDGRLTIQNAAGANNNGNKICFIEITPM